MVAESLERITADTLGEIEGIAAAFFEEAGHPGEFNFLHFSTVWKQILELDRGFIFVIREDAGWVSGLIGAICGPDVYSGETSCFPQFWYVVREQRGQKDGLRLFREMEREAAERGSITILPGHLKSINPDGFKDFFEREGYEVREIMYRKVLK